MASGSRLRSPIRTKALAAQNRTATRRLEWDRIVFAALIAGNFKSLAIASSSWSTKVGTARIPAGLTTLGMRQVTFLVILLLAFGEWKGVATFRASDLHIWHDADLPRGS